MNKICCIICDKELGEHPSDEQPIEIIYGGTIWSTSGNYGSRLIDCAGVDLGVDELQLVICDNCVKYKKDKLFVHTKITKESYNTRPLVARLIELEHEYKLWEILK